MEQQLKAERDRRAAILTAEGVKQSAILTAEGEKQSAILRAEGQAQSTILRAQGESRAILQVFDAIHRGNVDPKLLSYEYIRMLPQIAQSSSSKLWMIPSDLTSALNAVTKGFTTPGNDPFDAFDDEDDAAEAAESGATKVRFPKKEKEGIADTLAATALPDIDQALADAKGEADKATDEVADSGTQSGRRFSPDAEAGQRPNLPGER